MQQVGQNAGAPVCVSDPNASNHDYVRQAITIQTSQGANLAQPLTQNS